MLVKLKHRDKYSSEEFHYFGTDPKVFDQMKWKTKRKVPTAYDEFGSLRPGFYTVFLSRKEMEENGLEPLTTFPIPQRIIIPKGRVYIDLTYDIEALNIMTGKAVMVCRGHQEAKITECRRKFNEPWLVFDRTAGFPLYTAKKMLIENEGMSIIRIDQSLAAIFS